ncbi:hypothetical protein MRX96_041097 [Rhipicephalus microplus]
MEAKNECSPSNVEDTRGEQVVLTPLTTEEKSVTHNWNTKYGDPPSPNHAPRSEKTPMAIVDTSQQHNMGLGLASSTTPRDINKQKRHPYDQQHPTYTGNRWVIPEPSTPREVINAGDGNVEALTQSVQESVDVTNALVGEALMTCDKAHLLPKGDNEIFMKVIAVCLEREKLDLKKINLPCFNQDQVDVLVKCRGEAYAKATSNKASARKKAADFKKCVDKAVRSKT